MASEHPNPMTDEYIEQHFPKRVRGLVRSIYDLLDENARLQALVSEQAREIARLREALEWYADERNYDGNWVPGRLAVVHPTCRCSNCVLGFEPDAGKRARAALAARGGES